MRFMITTKSAGGDPAATATYASARAGVLLSSERVRPGADGVRVSGAKRGEPRVTRGARDAFDAFWLVHVASRQEAVEWAGQAPGGGDVVVYEIFATEDFPTDPAERPGGWRDR